jgi:hypothetical protein
MYIHTYIHTYIFMNVLYCTHVLCMYTFVDSCICVYGCAHASRRTKVYIRCQTFLSVTHNTKQLSETYLPVTHVCMGSNSLPLPLPHTFAPAYLPVTCLRCRGAPAGACKRQIQHVYVCMYINICIYMYVYLHETTCIYIHAHPDIHIRTLTADASRNSP